MALRKKLRRLAEALNTARRQNGLTQSRPSPPPEVNGTLANSLSLERRTAEPVIFTTCWLHCDYCRGYKIRPWSSFDQLKQNPCQIIAVLLCALTKLGHYPEGHELFKLWGLENMSAFFVEYTCRGQSFKLQLYVTRATKNAIFSLNWPVARHYEVYDRTAAMIAFARKHLAACECRHRQCSANPYLLPDRLIEIGQPGDFEGRACSYIAFQSAVEAGSLEFRLVDTAGISKIGQSSLRYACLSYCWGDKLSLGCLKRGANPSRRNIDWNDLPRTFRDAIAVTRCLGLRYIWVDALCIIQDGTTGWLRHAERTSDIFRSATVTIAAAEAKSCDEGFLGKGLEIWGQRVEVACAQYNNRTRVFNMNARCWNQNTGDDPIGYAHAYIEPQSRHGRFQKLHETHEKREKGKVFRLATRGWAFQEYCLSPRVLVFTANEVGWECFQNHECECDETVPMLKELRYRVWEYTTPKRAILKRRLDPTGVQSLQEWQRLVHMFCSRSLTYPSDRLPALSGIAREFTETPGVRYYAGHFSPDFVQSLTWTVMTPWFSQSTYGCRDTYIAPSWSFASICSPFYIRNMRPSCKEKFRPIAEARDIQCDSSEPDGTGSVTDGSLTLYAPVTIAHFEDEDENYPDRWVMHDAMPASILQLLPESFKKTSKCVIDTDFAPDAPTKPSRDNPVVCVWLGIERQFADYWNYAVMICERVPGDGNGVADGKGGGRLRRIGAVNLVLTTENRARVEPPWDEIEAELKKISREVVII